MIHLSPGNSKLGRIPNISLPPHTVCRKDAPCKGGCYAVQAYRQYPSAFKAWNENLQFYKERKFGYFATLYLNLSRRRKPMPYFRWHVSGDVVDKAYARGMIDIARALPGTKFLAHTKKLELFDGLQIPKNLILRASLWPGWNPKLDATFPKTWMQDGTEMRVPKNAIKCKGSCVECFACWNSTRDVVINKH